MDNRSPKECVIRQVEFISEQHQLYLTAHIILTRTIVFYYEETSNIWEVCDKRRASKNILGHSLRHLNSGVSGRINRWLVEIMKTFCAADKQSSAESTQALIEFFRDLKCDYPCSPFSSQHLHYTRLPRSLLPRPQIVKSSRKTRPTHKSLIYLLSVRQIMPALLQ